MKDLSALIQTNSLELVAGDAKEFPGAAPGDHVLPRDGERILIKGSTGYRYMILDAWEGFPEFRLNRGGYVGPHDDKPGDAVWLKAEHSPDGKAGLYRVGGDGSPGNRIEHTIYVRVLVLPDDGSAPFIVTQSYKSTAKTIANDMLNRASRKLDGEDVANCVTSLWRMTSRLEKKDSFRWFGPVATLLGRFGEPNGPTAEQLGLAAQLRKALKRGAALGPLGPPEPLPAPSIESETRLRARSSPAGASEPLRRRLYPTVTTVQVISTTSPLEGQTGGLTRRAKRVSPSNLSLRSWLQSP